VNAPTADDLRRLQRILELATRGGCDGEQLAALNRAKSWFDSHGLRWEDLLTGTPPPPPPAPRGWQAVVRDLQRHRITAWEVDFPASVSSRWSLSEKQENVLRRMCLRYGVVPWSAFSAW
jgi:hypothetical protein